ncbi:MAG: efflux RND transporter periplasmic adaptor subunit [Bryobacterales bacterium]|nr:efflux RND transporter periplasmic adaptor subunit [Bryobacterales bacterium]
MKWKRWVGIAVVAVGVVALVVWGFRPSPIAVEIARVARGPMRVTIEEEGKTRVKDRFVVHAPVAGYARRISLEVGDTVRAGQVVALLDPQPQRAAVLDHRTRAEAQARVERAQAALLESQSRIGATRADASYWEGQLARVQRLVQSGDLPAEQLERARTEKRRVDATLEALESAVAVAEAEVAAARATLLEPADTEIRPKGDLVRVISPVAGRVLSVVRKSEGPVQPGDPLLELGNARSLEIAVEVLSADAVKLHPGTAVVLERWGGEQPLEGVVRSIEPTAFTKVSALGVEEQRVRVIADIGSPEEHWSRLGDGYRVEASFVLWQEEQVLQAPASALFRVNGGWAVFVREGEHAKRREVTIGQRNGLSAQVLDGLGEGDEIVRHPDDTVEDGTLITPRELR